MIQTPEIHKISFSTCEVGMRIDGAAVVRAEKNHMACIMKNMNNDMVYQQDTCTYSIRCGEHDPNVKQPKKQFFELSGRYED